MGFRFEEGACLKRWRPTGLRVWDIIEISERDIGIFGIQATEGLGQKGTWEYEFAH